MSDVNLQLVRELFELHLFRVLTNWQQDPSEAGPLLFVENDSPEPLQEMELVLAAADISAIERAAVEVRAWHGERMYPSVLQANPSLGQSLTQQAEGIAREVFGERPFKRILVISELPVSPRQRERSLQSLQQGGIDHIIEFPSILAGLVERVSSNGRYPSSSTLQLLRVLKRYGFVKQQQLEFLFQGDPPLPLRPLSIETETLPAEYPGDDDEDRGLSQPNQ